MRVLIIHNRYRTAMPSGENRVVERDIAMLREAGAEVRSHITDSDTIGEMGLARRLELAVRPIYSVTDTAQLTAVFDEWRPDVVHLHNPYPLISPAFIRRARARGIPVVQTVHNYRHVCVSGLFAREGAPCRDCAGRRVPIPAVRHGCYRGSRAQSVVMAAALTVHQSTWRSVDRFVAVSPMVGRFLVDDLGVDPGRVAVRPNSLRDPGPAVCPTGAGFLFVGRLEELKGIQLLIDAWRSGAPSGWHLTIAGDGPSRAAVERLAREREDVTYEGAVSSGRVRELMDGCRVLLVPSVWYEAMPMVVVEAFSRGRPVLGTSHGALADLIDPSVGWLCEPTSASLAASLQQAAAGPIPGHVDVRKRFDDRYRGDDAADWLLNEYEALMAARGVRP